MRILSGVMSALFLYAAVVQWNDPDPILWTVGYLVACGLSAAAAAGRTLWIPSLVAASLFLVWFLTLAPSLIGADAAAFQSLEMKAASHEEPREAIGLLLCAAWTAYLAWRGRPRRG